MARDSDPPRPADAPPPPPTAAGPAADVAAAVREGRLDPVDVALAALARAEAAAERYGAVLHVPRERALAAAERVRERVAAGEAPPLAGVPLAVKDNLCVAGLPATAGSRILAGFTPPYTATVIERLEAAGAVLVAKTSLDEFGMGSSSERGAFGPTRNPWDPERVPGGSSGGSAAAVAAGVAPLALGTDTGGSVRQPAALCGVLGLKPTYGLLSRYGAIAYASSLDQVGPFGRSAGDLAAAMDAMAGRDPADATSVAWWGGEGPDGGGSAWARRAAGGSFADAVARGRDAGLAGARVGVLRELSGDGIQPGVRAALAAFRERLERLGADVFEVPLPLADEAVAAYYVVATAEASSNLARFDGMVTGARTGDDAEGQAAVMARSRAAGFGPEVRRRILMGTFALSAGYQDAYYGRALRVRRLVADALDAAFADADLLLCPTAPTTAWPLGERLDDPLAMYLGDVTTCLANLAGIGAISVPAGLSDGLPVGAQLMAPALADDRLLAAAAALEEEAGGPAPLAPGAL